jgi:hypothetical protein
MMPMLMMLLLLLPQHCVSDTGLSGENWGWLTFSWMVELSGDLRDFGSS